MIYLLDTDAFVFMIRGLKATRHPTQRRRAEVLRQRCHERMAAGHSVGLSAITVSELEFGAHSSRDYQTEIAAVRKLLSPFDVYDYDTVSCPPHYGRVRQELESKGTPIGAMDLLVAAHALALDATLVTNNVVHFSRVAGLKHENWLTRA